MGSCAASVISNVAGERQRYQRTALRIAERGAQAQTVFIVAARVFAAKEHKPVNKPK